MSEEKVIELGQNMMFNALLISLPLLGTGLIVGLIISVFQAATQINEQTLSIVPKLLVVGITLMLLMPWLLSRIVFVTRNMFEQMVEIVRNT